MVDERVVIAPFACVVGLLRDAARELVGLCDLFVRELGGSLLDSRVDAARQHERRDQGKENETILFHVSFLVQSR
jgi:hypothetical protein